MLQSALRQGIGADGDYQQDAPPLEYCGESTSTFQHSQEANRPELLTEVPPSS